MVPDHLGAWPLNLPEATDRHHVPLVMVGGALKRHSLAVNTPGSQIDIAATLLRQLGADTKPFTFSKDLLNPQSPHFAVFTEPELIEIVTPTDTMSYNIETGTGTAQAVKAYLQKLYQTIVDL
jgi:phosphoglycerol transferase MdoB-like AlkP superfamily enzyme